MKRLIALGICFCVLLSGCSKSMDRSDLIGKYTANHRKGLDVTELKENGAYVHTYQPPGGAAVTNSNKWELSRADGASSVTFSKFSFGLGIGSTVSGFWDVEVERFGNKKRLSIDPDLNYYYEMA